MQIDAFCRKSTRPDGHVSVDELTKALREMPMSNEGHRDPCAAILIRCDGDSMQGILADADTNAAPAPGAATALADADADVAAGAETDAAVLQLMLMMLLMMLLMTWRRKRRS